MGWQLFMAFIASSVGKEGALGVISALFTDGSVYGAFSDAMSGAADSSNLSEILLSNVTKPEALAFIFAITFNMPCVVALAATYQETHSAKWTAKIAAYYTFGALLIAMIVYHLGLLIW
jgi:ferrous iron transport protein B